jgi:hypothetical protein
VRDARSTRRRREARTYLPELFPEAENESLRLEGAELSDDERFWVVTFSFLEATLAAGTPEAPIFPSMRLYKTVKLKASGGELMGIRNGFLEAA